MRQSSSRSQAGRTWVCSNHSNCKRGKLILKCALKDCMVYTAGNMFTINLGVERRICSYGHWPEIGDHEWVLECGVSAGVEAVHPTESLARRSSTQHLHITLLRQLLAKGIRLLSRHDQLQQDVAVLSEHCGARVVEPEGLCCRLPHLYGPQSLRDT